MVEVLALVMTDDAVLVLRAFVERLSARAGVDALDVLVILAEWMQELLDESTEDTVSVARITQTVHAEIDRLIAEG